jgi:hypothetical protein
LFTDKQKWIGYADVKSVPVHFHVTRNSDFVTKHTPIPFKLALVNEGNAMDLTTGIFTAPMPGIYFFSFADVARLSAESAENFASYLRLNGEIIGGSNVVEKNGPIHQSSPMSFQLTLNLKMFDRLWVEIDYLNGSDSYLYADDNYFTHFTGFMLEEEIAALL